MYSLQSLKNKYFRYKCNKICIGLVSCKPQNTSEISQSEKVKVLVTQSCPTLYNPMDWGTPGSSIHRISQVRIQEWVAISFSRGSSQLRDRTHDSCLISYIVGRFSTSELLYSRHCEGLNGKESKRE